MRRIAACLIALFALSAAVERVHGADAPVPWAESQIASTTERLLGVIGDDRKSVLVSFEGNARWERLTPAGTFGRLTGLTTDGTSFFVADGEQRSLFRIGAKTRHVTRVADLAGIEPGELAFPSTIVVADQGGRDLVLVAPGRAPHPFRVSKLLAGDGPIHIASDGAQRIVAGVGDTSLLVLTLNDDLNAVVDASFAYGAQRNESHTVARTAIPLIPFPPLAPIRSLAMRNGLIYVAAGVPRRGSAGRLAWSRRERRGV